MTARRSMRARRLLSAAAGLGLLTPLLAVAGGGAGATYPGDNGRLAFGMSVGGNVDVWSASADGSGLQRLTDDPGFDACPAYSPSGRRIAFCSNRSGSFQIWTMSANGALQHQLSDLEGGATFPDWSPSGHHVAFDGAFASGGHSEIWRVRDDGSRLQQLTYTPSLDEGLPVWRPGHEQLAFIRFDDPYLGTQIWLMNSRGAHQRPLTFDDTFKDQVPDWRPDGRRLAYTADDDIWVMRADGSHQRNLTQSEAVEFGAAWSPDGSRIAFLRDEGATRPVYTMAADGSDEQVLLPDSTDRQYVPSWQPAPRHSDCIPRVKNLGTLPGGDSSEVLAMNHHGVIVGGALNSDEVSRAVWWRHGRIHNIGVRGGAWAADVNEHGTIVGNFAIDEDTEDASGHAFIWRRGHVDRLPGIGGDTEFVRRINEHGVAVGSAQDPDGREQPVEWRNNRVHELGVPGRFDAGYAMGINDHGDVVGAVYSRTEFRAWKWNRDGDSDPLDRLGTFAQPNVIDNAGRAAGISDFGGNPGAYAALWPGGRRVQPLGVFGTADFSFALGTSGRGDFVGEGAYYPSEDGGHVFLRKVTDYSVARTVTPQSIPTADVPSLRTLMPLSGDPADDSKSHAVLRSFPSGERPGSVTVGGSSDTAAGDKRATLWTCAYQQAFVPVGLTDPPPASRRSSDTVTLDPASLDRRAGWTPPASARTGGQ